jgi:Holliday junction resolvase-like predicted endonuclease
VADGELDLLAMDGRSLVAVEVRTTMGLDDPIDAIGHAKRRRVTSLAGAVSANRVDLLGIRLGEEGIDFHWVQN